MLLNIHNAHLYATISVRQVLKQPFHDRIMSRNFTISYLPGSPNLTPMDYWFWGYLKLNAHTTNRKKLSEFIDAIKCEVVQIPSAMLISTSLSTVSSMQWISE